MDQWTKQLVCRYREVLTEFNLVVAPGETVALVAGSVRASPTRASARA